MNISLTIAYDGTSYLGWQMTNAGSSIEETLRTAIEKILQEPIFLQAASRTDAGVHAEGQVVNFITTKEYLKIDKLQRSINAVLPPTIVIHNIAIMPNNFHPTLDATGKEYHYNICYGPIQFPRHRYFSWHFPYDLDIVVMTEAAQLFIGEKDFSALRNRKKNENQRNSIREISKIAIIPLSNSRLRIEVEGTSFLYKMVRNIVGTIAYVGSGKLSLADVRQIIASRNRTIAGITAPAHGLTLLRVKTGA